MKEERIEIRANEEFVEKVDYLKRINDYKSRADTIRKTVEKEYRKESKTIAKLESYKMPRVNDEYSEEYTEGWNEALGFAVYLLRKEKENGKKSNT